MPNPAGSTPFLSNPDVVLGLIVALFIANVMLLILNIPMVGIFVSILLGNQMEDNLRRALTISNGD